MRKLLVMMLLMTPMLSIAQVKAKKSVINKTQKQSSIKAAEKVAEQSNQPKTIIIQGSYLGFAQDNGFSFTNGSKEYIVIDAPNYTQKELFSKMLLALNNYYIDIDKVVSKIEYDALTINATYIPDAPMSITKRPYILANSGAYLFLSIDYRLSFKFKDGKVRIDIPYIKSGTAIEDISEKKVFVEHSDLNFGAYNSMTNDFNGILVKLLKDAYQSKDDEW